MYKKNWYKMTHLFISPRKMASFTHLIYDFWILSAGTERFRVNETTKTLVFVDDDDPLK